MFFKFKPFEAPTVYKFKDPDTSHEYYSATRGGLLRTIVDYRYQNDLPEIEHLEEVLDHYLCTLPENINKCEVCDTPRGVMQIYRGGLSLLKTVLLKKMVPLSVASARTKICYMCPNNQYPTDADRSVAEGGSTVFDMWSTKVAEQATTDRPSAYDKKLKQCIACSCPLKVKVNSVGPFKLTKTERFKMPEYCWQLEELHPDSESINEEA